MIATSFNEAFGASEEARRAFGTKVGEGKEARTTRGTFRDFGAGR